MILKNELYKIKDKSVTDKGATFDIELNDAHFIYQAHFPGEPITPGVCMIQIAKELLEETVDCSLQIVKVKNVKFLSVLTPGQSADVTYSIGKIVKDDDGNIVKAQAVVTSAGEAKAKISFVCTIK